MVNVGREKVLILVKALPHVGEKHGETVCCAGVTENGEWRRQYPIHFRNLKSKFKRWQWIEYDWILPRDDARSESRRVQEDTIAIEGEMPSSQRARFLAPIVVRSTDEAVARNQTLALIRPKNVRFHFHKKTAEDIKKEREAYAFAASQKSFFDDELKALDPCPYAFKFDYWTEDGKSHKATCDDWETSAMFYNFQNRYGENEALAIMDKTFNEEYPRKGMAFAMGTHSRRSQQWLLVGVIRLDEIAQMPLGL